MTKQSFTLDPNAQSYTDDEIVGKVNTAAAAISRADAIDGAALGACDMDDLGDGTTNKGYTATEQTKLGTVEDSATTDQTGAEIKTAYEAEANAYTDTKDTKLTGIEADAKDDQTGAEVRDLIVGIAEADRKIVITEPSTGEFKVLAVHRDATGKLEVEYDDVAEP